MKIAVSVVPAIPIGRSSHNDVILFVTAATARSTSASERAVRVLRAAKRDDIFMHATRRSFGSV